MQPKPLQVLFASFLWVFAFLTGLFTWLTPLPIFYMSRRYSLKVGGLCFGLGLCLIFFLYWGLFAYAQAFGPRGIFDLFSWLPGIGFGNLFGAKTVWGVLVISLEVYGSLALVLAWKSRQETNAIRLVGFIWGLVFLAVSLSIVILCQGDIFLFTKGLQRYFEYSLDQFLSLNPITGLPSEDLLFLQKYKTGLVSSFLKVFPGIAASALLFLVWLNLIIARRLFKPLRFFDTLEDLGKISVSFLAVWAVLAHLALFLLSLYWLHWSTLEVVTLNSLIFLAGVYFFQGLAIAVFFLRQRLMNPWFRLLFYFIFLFFIQPLSVLLVAAGFFDSWFNFRKLKVDASAS